MYSKQDTNAVFKEIQNLKSKVLDLEAKLA